jgi:hypothetical protein
MGGREEGGREGRRSALAYFVISNIRCEWEGQEGSIVIFSM